MTDDNGNVLIHKLYWNILWNKTDSEEFIIAKREVNPFVSIANLEPNCDKFKSILNKYRIVAIGSVDRVIIIQVTPSIEVIHKIKKPLSILRQKSVVPHLSFGFSR